MPRRPDAVCAGGCGKPIWRGTGSRPSGQQMCRPCRATQPKVRRSAPPRPLCAEPGCPKRPRSRDRCWRHCPDFAPRMREHYRNQTHRRRRASAEQHTDISTDYERNLRAKAKRCPLCKVRMVSQPYLPASKELDHIIPLNVGGTHTIGNVRIICRSCNARRPIDGSDYEGPVTLWAQVPLLPRVPRRIPTPRTCGCGAPRRRGRCWSCQPSRKRGSVDIHGNPLTTAQQHARNTRAAELRASGTKWQDIANELGFGSPGSAYLAAAKAA